MYKISGADLARSEEVLRRVKEERNILEKIKRRRAHWIGHIVRRNCLLKHVTDREIEGRIEVMRR
jgi:ppGpp synthetase/RelA/SpoT-type nucleotidyltranferase